MNTPQESLLGREVAYPSHYDPALLFPIPRAAARAEIGLDAAVLPFTGHDRWHAYELAWLDTRGKPQVATATLTVPADAPNLIESKSLKLYLNSLNAERFETLEAVCERVAADLSARAGGAVTVQAGLPPFGEQPGTLLDALELDIDDYGPPNPAHLAADADDPASETLVSHLLKSNCPVTGQPDWGTVVLRYDGPRIDHAGLLRYLVSFRDHAGFHEQCVERIFADVSARCAPQRLSVEARYTRRGGLDINPWRITPGWDAGITTPIRELRQ
ncbi:NADPH-dependent 7-cyano-7-deazaguanine reductase QueF [Pseudoxanthomonas winnipegensis]|uniref:NADPH-dependent 7-cyano-7-deazaguanine reductase QueF n=1 Tax=Pseudoxanthomonas winnipegensis TaxID=2480810 RepID=UPI0030F39023